MSKLLTWLSVSFNWYTYCVYTTPPTVTCGGGLPCAVNCATPAAVATTATPSARRMENVIGWLPSWGMGCDHAASQGGNESNRVTPWRGECNEPVTGGGGVRPVPRRRWGPAGAAPPRGPRVRRGGSARRGGRPAAETGAPGWRAPPGRAPRARSSPVGGRALPRRAHHPRPARGAGGCAAPPPPPPRRPAGRSRPGGRGDRPGAAAPASGTAPRLRPAWPPGPPARAG